MGHVSVTNIEKGWRGSVSNEGKWVHKQIDIIKEVGTVIDTLTIKMYQEKGCTLFVNKYQKSRINKNSIN